MLNNFLPNQNEIFLRWCLQQQIRMNYINKLSTFKPNLDRNLIYAIYFYQSQSINLIYLNKNKYEKDLYLIFSDLNNELKIKSVRFVSVTRGHEFSLNFKK